MSSERQIAANRRNSRKSTGPRSAAGKKRASCSSYRHGLRARTAPGAQRAKHIERLARKIAGASTNAIVLEGARAAAQAEFDIARVKQLKVAVIEQMLAVGEVDPPPTKAATPSTEQERLAEAVRRALPELLTLDRYERRAAVRRERAAQMIFDRRKT